MKSPSFWNACVWGCRCRLHVGSNRPIHTTFRNIFNHWKWPQFRNSKFSTTGSNMADVQNDAVGTTLKTHDIYRDRIRRTISSHVIVKLGCNYRVREKGIYTASASNTSVTARRCSDSSRVKTERDGTRAETRFGLPAKRTSPFISAWVSVQSSTGFLGVRVGGERL